MIDIETYALAKAYTDKAIEGGGAIQGKNCIITEIEDVGNTHIVHFQWTLDDGTVETDTMTVEDGDLVEASETNGNIKINGVETQVYNDAEIKADIDAIDDVISTDEVTKEGNPINFTTKSAQNAKSTILSVEPIQDLHGYDKPWVGGAGKNLLEAVESGGINTSNGSKFNEPTRCRISDMLLLKANTNYVLTGYTKVTGKTLQIGYETWDHYGFGSNTIKVDSGWLSPNISLLFTEDTWFTCIYRYSDNSQISYTDITSQLEKGSQATSYEPYENICPISGRTEIGILGIGKNEFSGIEDGTWNTNTQSKTSEITRARSKDIISIEGNTTYALSFTGSENKTIQVAVHLYSGLGSGKAISLSPWETSPYIFTTPSDARYTTILFKTSDGADTPSQYVSNIQLEKNNQSTTFEPYTKSNDLTIDLGDTVYGCQIKVEEGQMVVNSKRIDLGDLRYAYDTTNHQYFTNVISDAKTTQSMQTDGILCSGYVVDNREYSVLPTVHIRGIFSGDKRLYIAADSDSYSFSGVQLLYPLATPTVVNLTPNTINLLKGVNNISVDDENATITLTYRDGSVATLGDLTSAVNELDGKIEDSKILTDTATGDKYILVVTNGVLSVEQISN